MDEIKLNLQMNESLFMKLLLGGSGAPLAGLFVSLSTHNEELQCFALLLGIIISLFTIGIAVIKWINKWTK